MAVVYETMAEEDLDLGYGSVSKTNPGGGTMSGSKVGIHSFLGDGYLSAADQSGANAGAKISAAITALPAGGGIVDCRSLTGAQTIATDVFAAVTKNVDLIIGHGTWTVTLDTTIPDNITLWFSAGSMLSPASTKTLTIAGSINSAQQQIFTGSGTTSLTGMVVISPVWFGAKGDGKVVTDGAMTSGSPTLLSATAAFTSRVTGMVIYVIGAGTAGVALRSTMTYVSATTVTLANNAVVTVSGATVVFGTDSATPITSATNAAPSRGTVRFPRAAGFYWLPGSVTPSGTGWLDITKSVTLEGDSRDVKIKVGPEKPASNGVFIGIEFRSGLNSVIRNLTIEGPESNNAAYFRLIYNFSTGGQGLTGTMRMQHVTSTKGSNVYTTDNCNAVSNTPQAAADGAFKAWIEDCYFDTSQDTLTGLLGQPGPTMKTNDYNWIFIRDSVITNNSGSLAWYPSAACSIKSVNNVYGPNSANSYGHIVYPHGSGLGIGPTFSQWTNDAFVNTQSIGACFLTTEFTNTLQFTGCKFLNSNATNGDAVQLAGGATFINCYFSAAGRGIQYASVAAGSIIRFEGCEFKDTYFTLANTDVCTTFFKNNYYSYSNAEAVAVYISNVNATVDFDGNTIIGNSGLTDAVIQFLGSTSVRFQNNTINNTGVPRGVYFFNGAGAHSNPKAYVRNNSFTDDDLAFVTPAEAFSDGGITLRDNTKPATVTAASTINLSASYTTYRVTGTTPIQFIRLNSGTTYSNGPTCALDTVINLIMEDGAPLVTGGNIISTYAGSTPTNSMRTLRYIPGQGKWVESNPKAGQQYGVTAAIATGATVTHGYGAIPDFVLLTPQDSGPSAYYPSAIGSTTFVINYTGGGTHVFAWYAGRVP